MTNKETSIKEDVPTIVRRPNNTNASEMKERKCTGHEYRFL